ncbi:MAG: hypothetical protein JWR20_2709 [Marmoricola sp.]|jgi:hypothetical protein|nr:hypothetical protein [Marmoricola sp.]
MVLSVGQALDRAREEALVVRLQVGGEWLTGRVVACDGHGVAFEESDGVLVVVRADAVLGVRLPAARPSRPVHSERVDPAPRGPSPFS